jgi:phosphatidylglycerol---prolipoprotein diacylglyceryl transferase
MRPILFYWRGRPVWSYPALLYLGTVVGLIAGNGVANARGLDGTRVYFAAVLLLPVALLGARLTFVAAHWHLFRDRPAQMWRRDIGGQAMFGGLIAVPISLPLLASLEVPFWAFWDIGVVIILIGMVFTRIGCLLNGCCAGRPTTSRLGLVLRDRAGIVRRRIPTQLLEAALGATVLVMVWLVPMDANPGTMFLTANAGYAAGRALLEGTRERSSVAGFGSIRAFSLALAGVAVVLLWQSAGD